MASDWGTIEYGVPQGSILGPLLFLLYINDLPDMSEHFAVLFADDCSSVIRDSSMTAVENAIRKSLENFEAWFANNNLKLNLNKTNLLIINKKEEINIQHNNGLLTSSEGVRFLGLQVDSFLTWKSHIDYLAG